VVFQQQYRWCQHFDIPAQVAATCGLNQLWQVPVFHDNSLILF
jgi:hypothetical protein